MEYPDGNKDENKDRRITQLRKGILELAVMGVLFHERHYGYSLVRVLTESESISIKEGTIYPILARLDRDDLVRSEWVESDQGPPRKYYTLTPLGRQVFNDLSQEFDLLVSLAQRYWTEQSKSKLAVRKG